MSSGGSASKRKGSSFEREIANDLTKRLGETFIRVPYSGAFIGGSNSKKKEILHEGQIRTFKGDIIPGPSYSNWNVECKSYKDFPFHRLFHNTKIPQLDQWIDQLLDVADEGDVNLLFMKFNRKGRYVLHNLKDFECFGIPYNDVWNFTSYDLFVEVLCIIRKGNSLF